MGIDVVVVDVTIPKFTRKPLFPWEALLLSVGVDSLAARSLLILFEPERVLFQIDEEEDEEGDGDDVPVDVTVIDVFFVLLLLLLLPR